MIKSSPVRRIHFLPSHRLRVEVRYDISHAPLEALLTTTRGMDEEEVRTGRALRVARMVFAAVRSPPVPFTAFHTSKPLATLSINPPHDSLHRPRRLPASCAPSWIPHRSGAPPPPRCCSTPGCARTGRRAAAAAARGALRAASGGGGGGCGDPDVQRAAVVYVAF